MALIHDAIEKAAELGTATRRMTMRGKLEIEARRLEAHVREEKARIGEALFPLIRDGLLVSNLPEVGEHMDTVYRLERELDAKHQEIDALREEQAPEAPFAEASEAGFVPVR